MKKLLLFIPLLLVLVTVLSSHKPDSVRKQPKFSIVPPGGIWLRDSVFMDMTEVRNLDYLEFLYWVNRHNDTILYKKILPDTLVWRTKQDYNEPYVLYYLRHPSYRDYPVVGISYEQAVLFCKWRTDRVNAYIMVKNKEANWPAVDTMKHFIERIRYRLPTKQEWEYAANAGLDPDIYNFGYMNLLDKKGLPVTNTKEYANLFHPPHRTVYIRSGCEWWGTQMNDASEITTPVYFGKANCYGIYNLIGNVSEIIADSVVKGYNYLSYLDGTYTGGDDQFKPEHPDSLWVLYYKNDYHYSGPQRFLGFRCVAEVLK